MGKERRGRASTAALAVAPAAAGAGAGTAENARAFAKTEAVEMRRRARWLAKPAKVKAAANEKTMTAAALDMG